MANAQPVFFIFYLSLDFFEPHPTGIHAINANLCVLGLGPGVRVCEPFIAVQVKFGIVMTEVHVPGIQLLVDFSIDVVARPALGTHLRIIFLGFYNLVNCRCTIAQVGWGQHMFAAKGGF